MAEKGGDKNSNLKAVFMILLRAILPMPFGVGLGLLVGKLPVSSTTKILILLLIGVIGLLCITGCAIWWYGFVRPRIIKKIKDNEAKMAELKAEMLKLEIEMAQGSKFLALLEKMRDLVGFDKYRWN